MTVSLLKDFDKKYMVKTLESKKIEEQKSELVKSLVSDLIDFYKNNLDELIDFSELKLVSNSQKLSILENVIKYRKIDGAEITTELLQIIERVKEPKPFIFKLFRDLEKKEKLTFGLFCSGFDVVGKQYDFIKEYLLLEYNLSFGYNEKNQYICVDGYNYKTDTAMLKVQLSKGQSVHLDTMAKCINDLVNDGYKEPVISIFEKSLSRYKSYYLQTLDNETLTLITPQIITSSDDIVFKGQGVSYTEQLESCLEYIAKYLYY